MEALGWDLYRHDQQTIQDLFQSAFNEVDEVSCENGDSRGPEPEKVQWKVNELSEPLRFRRLG